MQRFTLRTIHIQQIASALATFLSNRSELLTRSAPTLLIDQWIDVSHTSGPYAQHGGLVAETIHHQRIATLVELL
jgi:hypothetical protein